MISHYSTVRGSVGASVSRMGVCVCPSGLPQFPGRLHCWQWAVKDTSSSVRNIKAKPQRHSHAQLLGSLDWCLVSCFLVVDLFDGFLPSYIQVSELALGYIFRCQIWCMFQLKGVHSHPVSIPPGQKFCAANCIPLKSIKLPVSFVSMNCGKPFSRKC